MKILIFGISNVGKTTFGKLLAEKIQYDFVDLDEEIKNTNGTIKKFQERYPNQKKRDKVRAKMIDKILDAHENVVVALSPIAYLDAYDSFFENENILCFEF